MSAIIAIIPIVLLFVLMLGLKMAGHKSAFLTLLVTIALALFVAPAMGFVPKDFTFAGVGWAVVEGVLKAVFPILIIILMAIFSYNVLVESKEIEVIKNQFTSFSDDKGVTVLMLVWGFGGLLEGMAGFGTAVAIPAAILISLGYKPVFSALVALIANTVPTGFGAVGVPVITLCNEVAAGGVASPELICEVSTYCVVQLSPLFIILPFIILTLTNRSRSAIGRNLLISLWVGGISLATQYVVAMFLGAETPAIIGSVAAIIALVVYSKLFAPKKDNGNVKHYTAAETFRAWSVYFFILLFILLSGPLFPDINSFLKSHLVSRVALPIYADGTTFNFGWISNAGLMLLLGTVIGGLIQGVSPRKLLVILARTTVNLRKTVITIISLVSLASVMNYAGMIVVIASALAAVTGQLYPVFAPLIGAIGTFVTGSDTSSNILFAKLQANVAHQLNYGNSDWLVAANTTGATGGKMISPQSIAIATAACDMQGRDGEILKAAIPYAIAYIAIGGLMVLLAV
ncbi:lactate permease LctP family transporter [uncultured Prevotella sp.]|uniref:L-lactate permease n=1 Tax=uncultured Prevotella sp. TaxID=159272 RepID=UPI0027D987B9|nr:lactate permease LctP family transporter [uncultured Prevotella sp.]